MDSSSITGSNIPASRVHERVEGVALDLSHCLRDRQTGEVLLSAREAIDCAVDLIQQAVKADPAAAKFIRAQCAPIRVIMRDGPLAGYYTEFETFFGMVPAHSAVRAPEGKGHVKGRFHYAMDAKREKDAEGRVFFNFVRRLGDEEALNV